MDMYTHTKAPHTHTHIYYLFTLWPAVRITKFSVIRVSDSALIIQGH